MIGQTVSHYRVLRKIGEGGMGVVYEAEDLLLGRHVAIKFLTSARQHVQSRARFLREARAASALSDPHIAVVYDYGEAAGQEGDPYIVMELVDGRALDQLLRDEGGPLAPARAAGIVAGVAEALAEAHRHGVVHRDIKPANIVVGEQDAVKVLDFGLAKQIRRELAETVSGDAPTLPEARTASNVILGTPQYLSPEQAMAGAVDGRSDLFALGAVLYECLAGRPPFTGANVVEVCAQVLHVEPPPPSARNPRVTPELDRITLKALVKKPEARYQTADELLADLRAARTTMSESSGVGHLAPRPSGVGLSSSRVGPELFGRWRRSRLFVPTLLVAVAVALIGAWRAAPAVWMSGAGGRAVAPEALNWYERGLAALRDGSYFQASKMLERAVNVTDGFALAHARLAEAWMELDYTDRARDSILRAESLGREGPRLSQSDRLYLTAINAAVRRDFAAAIEAYAALAGTGQGGAQVYTDLGRAYEKNDEIDKAIESYTKATNLSQQYAAPFLRLGVLYGRKQALARASAAFAKAEAIYQTSSNLEGVAEVHYQRGVLANRLRRAAESREHLQRALDLAQTTGNKYQQISALIELSHAALNENDLGRARQLATQAGAASQSDDMENLYTLALIAAGNVYFLGGESGKAEDSFKQALAAAQRYRGERGAATARFMLGSVLINRGRADEGVRHVEESLAFFQAANYRVDAARAQHLLGLSKRQQGDYASAAQAFEQELGIARQLNDVSQMSLSGEGLGTTFLQQEKYPEALAQFEESLRLSRSLGDQIGVGFGLMNCGNALWRLGRYPEARGMYEQASAVARRPDGYKALMAVIQFNQAEMAISERRFAEARATAARALGLAGENNRELSLEVLRVTCRSRTLAGEQGEGRQACEKAVELATTAGDPWLLQKAELALAENLLESGDAPQSLKTALRLQEAFGCTGQSESAWHASLLAARAGQRLSDQAAAREHAALAARQFDGLQQRWGAEAFRQYLSRPDVGFYRRQIDELMRAN
ncbi:MAG: protein kinase domain-containing protein [Pyrinomonadaceae bacterium]